MTWRGGPSRVRSPQHAAAQGAPAEGVVFVSSSPFFPSATCPVVFWTHINFWYTVGCLIWSQAARKSSYSSSASFLSPAMNAFAACTTRGSEQSFLNHLLQVKEEVLHPRALGLSLSTWTARISVIVPCTEVLLYLLAFLLVLLQPLPRSNVAFLEMAEREKRPEQPTKCKQ